MKVDYRMIGGVLVVSFIGNKLDINAKRYLLENIMSYLNDFHCNIVIDIGHVEYIDSSGITVILYIVKNAINNGNKVAICRASEMAKHLFHRTRLDDIFNIYSNISTAVQTLS